MTEHAPLCRAVGARCAGRARREPRTDRSDRIARLVNCHSPESRILRWHTLRHTIYTYSYTDTQTQHKWRADGGTADGDAAHGTAKFSRRGRSAGTATPDGELTCARSCVGVRRSKDASWWDALRQLGCHAFWRTQPSSQPTIQRARWGS
jgi:hypothetical protein